MNALWASAKAEIKGAHVHMKDDDDEICVVYIRAHKVYKLFHPQKRYNDSQWSKPHN